MIFLAFLRAKGHRATQPRLVAAKGVVSTVHGSRTVLLDIRRGRYYGLDEVGTRIWTLSQEGFDEDSVIALLEAEYEAPREQIAADVARFFSTLRRSRLVEER